MWDDEEFDGDPAFYHAELTRYAKELEAQDYNERLEANNRRIERNRKLVEPLVEKYRNEPFTTTPANRVKFEYWAKKAFQEAGFVEPQVHWVESLPEFYSKTSLSTSRFYPGQSSQDVKIYDSHVDDEYQYGHSGYRYKLPDDRCWCGSCFQCNFPALDSSIHGEGFIEKELVGRSALFTFGRAFKTSGSSFNFDMNRSFNAVKDLWFGADFQLAEKVSEYVDKPLPLALKALEGMYFNSFHYRIYKQNVVAVERPVYFNPELHDTTRSCIEWANGDEMYFVGKREVPSWVVNNPTLKKILKEKNTEYRSRAIEVAGWDNLINQDGGIETVVVKQERQENKGWLNRLLGGDKVTAVESPRTAKVKSKKIFNLVDEDANPKRGLLYTIKNVSEITGANSNLLLVENGTPEKDGTFNKYGLLVPSECETVDQAQNWLAGFNPMEDVVFERRT